MRSYLKPFRIFCTSAGILLMVPGGIALYQSIEGQRAAEKEYAKSEAKSKLSAKKERGPAASSKKEAAPFRIVFPRLGVKRYVIPTYSEANLKRGPAWLNNTALPGNVGNCVIAAHRDTHFRFLRKVKRGDEIVVARDGKTYRYRVQSMFVVDPDNRALLAGTDARQLTLVTCFPFYYVGKAPQRYVVQAIAQDNEAEGNKTKTD